MFSGLPPSMRLLVVVYVLSTLGSAAMAGYAMRVGRDEPTVRAFAGFTLAVSVWTFGLTGRVLATTVPGKLAWAMVAYAGVVAFPLTWIWFTLSYTGYRHWVTRRFVALFLSYPVVTWLALASNTFHREFYVDVSLTYEAGWPLLSTEPGVLFWLHAAFGYAVFLAGVGLLVTHAFRSPHPYRRQAQVLVGTALLAWLVNVAYVVGRSPIPHVNPTPIALGIGSVVLAIAVFRIRFIDLVPVARETVLDRIDDAIVVIDASGRIVDSNARASALFGPGPIIGESAESVLPPALVASERAFVSQAGEWADGAVEGTPSDASNDGWFAEAPEAGGAVVDDREKTVTDTTETGLELALGRGTNRRWYLTRWFSVRGDASRGRIVALTDVTEQRRQRTVLERQNEQLEGLADVVSHDLRNPLDVVRGNLTELRESVAVDGDVSQAELGSVGGGSTEYGSTADRYATVLEGFDAIERSADRIDEIARNLVILARRGDHVRDPVPTAVAEVARSAWSTCDTQALTLTVEGAATVDADPVRLQQLFENLYRNAVEHATGARRVRVGPLWTPGGDAANSDDGGRNDGVPRQSIESPPNGSVGFYVEDDGEGIAEPDRQRVFEYGVTSRGDGTGLGLAIVREIAAAHGWRVRAVDGRSGGARFEVDVPAGSIGGEERDST